MALLQDFGGALADDDAGGHGVSRRDAGHDRSVGNTKMFDAVNLQIAIHDGHGISAHFGCAGFMPVTDGRVANELLEFWSRQVARHYFTLDKLSQWSRVADFSAELYAGNRRFEIVRM